MNAPLAPALGNALEVAEVMKVLRGSERGPLYELTLALGAQLLFSGGVFTSEDAAREALSNVIVSGAAAERFGKMIVAMGGPLGFVDNPQRYLPEAPVIREVTSLEGGYVSAIEGEALGLAVVALGGGRQVESDLIDPAVGLSDVVTLGAFIVKGQPLARIHAAREGQADRAAQAIRRAITLASNPPAKQDLVHEVIS